MEAPCQPFDDQRCDGSDPTGSDFLQGVMQLRALLGAVVHSFALPGESGWRFQYAGLLNVRGRCLHCSRSYGHLTGSGSPSLQRKILIHFDAVQINLLQSGHGSSGVGDLFQLIAIVSVPPPPKAEFRKMVSMIRDSVWLVFGRPPG